MIASSAGQPRNDEDSSTIEDNRWDRRNITDFREMVNTQSRRFLRFLRQTYEQDRQQCLQIMEDNDKKQTELNDRIKLLDRAIDKEK